MSGTRVLCVAPGGEGVSVGFCAGDMGAMCNTGVCVWVSSVSGTRVFLHMEGGSEQDAPSGSPGLHLFAHVNALPQELPGQGLQPC